VTLAIGRRVPRRLSVVLAGVSTILGTTVGFNGLILIPTAVLLILAGVAAHMREEWRLDDEEQKRIAALSAREGLEAAATADLEKLATDHGQFADVFAELTRAAADMADKRQPERVADFGILIKQTVNAIAWVLHSDIPGVRAVVYQLSDDEQRMDVADWASSTHRSAPQAFILGDDRGDKAFATLRAGESLFVDDIAIAPQDWAGSGVGYNTFITTPITSTTQGYGLLTVDAPDTDSLTEDDENDLRLIAGILAMIFAEKTRRVPGRVPGQSAQ
jgi:transcriptional regulator with GAF, ATPase, and Fis domain